MSTSLGLKKRAANLPLHILVDMTALLVGSTGVGYLLTTMHALYSNTLFFSIEGCTRFKLIQGSYKFTGGNVHKCGIYVKMIH